MKILKNSVAVLVPTLVFSATAMAAEANEASGVSRIPTTW